MRRARKAGPRQQAAAASGDAATAETQAAAAGTQTQARGKADGAPIQADGDQDEAMEKSVLDVLAEGVHNSWALLHTAILEFLACKDEILKQALPPALLLRTIVSTTKIFRLFSDANTPVLELLRLVKLYSADWEKQSVTLKKLHADNESKQRQLNIALRRIEMTAMEQQRIAKERRVMNWERLFAKLHNRQSHGRRWKFLIQPFKDKLREGKLNQEAYAPSKSDNENEADMDDGSVASGRVRATSRLRLSSREGSLGVSAISLDNASEEDKATDSPSANDNTAPSPAQHEQSDAAASEDEDFAIEDDGSPAHHPGRSSPHLDGRNNAQRPLQSRGMQVPSSDHSDDVGGQAAVRSASGTALAMRPQVETRDASVATHEIKYKRCFGLRVYPPKELKGFSAAAVTVSVADQVFDTEVFDMAAVTAGSALSYRYGQFEFQLPLSFGVGDTERGGATISTSLPSADDSTTAATATTATTAEEDELTLNVVLHGRMAQGPIVAMNTIPLKTLLAGKLDFLVCSEESAAPATEGDTSAGPSIRHLSSREVFEIDKQAPVDYDLRPMAGGTPSKLPLLAYQVKQEIPTTRQIATETLPLEELISEVADEFGFISKKEAEDARKCAMVELAQTNNSTQEEETGQLVEEHEKAIALQAMQHVDQLVAMQNRYEADMQALSDSLKGLKLKQEQPGVEQVTQTSAAATPEMKRATRHAQRMTRSQSSLESSTDPPPPVLQPAYSISVRPAQSRTMRKKSSRVSHPMPQDWLENVPKDFIERLEFFTNTSMERQEELIDTVRNQVSSIFIQQMEAHHRRARQLSSTDDICLPALFLPSNRPNVIYTPKAHSYFHPPGSSARRISQPPSILKLPAVPQKKHNALSTVNLFDLSQRYVSDGPYWWKDTGGQSPLTLRGTNGPPPPSMTQLRSFAGTAPSPKLDHRSTHRKEVEPDGDRPSEPKPFRAERLSPSPTPSPTAK